MPWTKITREQYQRNGLRYASDMTDAEWRLIARKLPPRRRLADREKLICAGWSRPFCSFCPAAASGVPCRGSSRHTRRCRAIFMPGATPAGGSGLSGRWSGKRGGSSEGSQHQRPPSSTVKVLRRRKPVGRAALIPASVSRGASGISSPTPTASCSPFMFIPPTFRMSMALCRCWSACETAFPDCGMFLPIGSIVANNYPTLSPIVGRGASRSSSGRQGSKASSSCLGAGSSNEPLHGSVGVAVSPETLRDPRPPKRLGFSSPISGF